MRLRVARRRIVWKTRNGKQRTRRTLEFWVETGDNLDRWDTRTQMLSREERVQLPGSMRSCEEESENQHDAITLAADL